MKNLGLALLETLITLVITQIPILLALVIYALGEKSATVKSAVSVLADTFSPGDALVYSAGILASSTAYAIMKIGSFKTQPILMLLLILLPILTVLSAMPLYIQDANDRIHNLKFAHGYIIGILVFSAILWIHALYQSRAFFDVQLPSSRGADSIIEDIEG